MNVLDWRRSSRCEAQHCVEVAFTDDEVHVRDSKYPKAPALTYDPASWQEMLDAIRSVQTPRQAADRLTDVLYLDNLREYCWRCEEFCLHFTRAEWKAFVEGVRNNEFDLPEPSHVR